MSFDIDSHDAPGATGSYDSDFASKAATAAGLLTARGYEFVLMHVKAVDDTGHDRMVAMKVGGVGCVWCVGCVGCVGGISKGDTEHMGSLLWANVDLHKHVHAVPDCGKLACSGI